MNHIIIIKIHQCDLKYDKRSLFVSNEILLTEITVRVTRVSLSKLYTRLYRPIMKDQLETYLMYVCILGRIQIEYKG